MTPFRWLVERLRLGPPRVDAAIAPPLGGLAPELRLRDNEATSFRGRPGCEITCKVGVALVTQEGDPEDHVLEVGDTLRISKAGRVVAMALCDCVLRVGGASALAGRQPVRSAWGRRARR